MNKANLLRNYFQSADVIQEIQSGKTYRFQVRNENFEFINIQDPKDVLTFTPAEIAEAFAQETMVTIGTCDFEAQKITTLTPPVALLGQEDLDTLFTNLADECNGDVYRGYSGRGMMGRMCWGVTTSDPESAIAAARGLGLTGERRDSMGLSMIVYWPNVEYVRPGERVASSVNEELVSKAA